MSKHQEDIFRVNENSPIWIKLCLGEIGIGTEFKVDNLTPDQHNQLEILAILMESVKDGYLEPMIRGKRVVFRKTGKALGDL